MSALHLKSNLADPAFGGFRRTLGTPMGICTPEVREAACGARVRGSVGANPLAPVARISKSAEERVAIVRRRGWKKGSVL